MTMLNNQMEAEPECFWIRKVRSKHPDKTSCLADQLAISRSLGDG